MILLRLLSMTLLAFLQIGCYGDPDGKGAGDALPLLQRLLRDPSSDSRRTAVIALGRIAAPDTAATLIPSLQDSDPRVRRWAAWALGTVGQEGPPEVGVALAGRLADPSQSVRTAAAQALGELPDDPAVTTLLEQSLRSGSPDTRVAAAYALIGRSSVDALEAVLQGMKPSTPTLRQAAVAGLGEAGGPRVVPMLVERLHTDVAANVRSEAAYRLGLVGDREVLPALRQAENNDGDVNVRRWAGMAAEAIRSVGARDLALPLD